MMHGKNNHKSQVEAFGFYCLTYIKEENYGPGVAIWNN